MKAIKQHGFKQKLNLAEQAQRNEALKAHSIEQGQFKQSIISHKS
eukprot:CAMPEP_0170499384 /NCGR_PEP_ID=MMETSP0208-20121228/31222_1 /TAXON_ID=197538 /ORGANISM="Strombidium inclinatum, Strain S3" /LENGTH=44 /DNA_ID= /DNA_START= /DNA_END= /DNA_ORIENTATION=